MTDFQSLNPMNKAKSGGWGGVAMVGLGIGIVITIGVLVNNFLETGLSKTGALSTLDDAGFITGEATEDLADQLTGGAVDGKYQYETVSFSKTLTTGAGGSFATLDEYIWKEAPEYWLNPLTIENDYTTPHNKDGVAIAIPTKSTITDSILDGTLSTMNALTPAVVINGRTLIESRRYWVHANITATPDLFFTIDVPNAGEFDTITPTLTLESLVVPQLDTTAWDSSAIDLGADVNSSTVRTEIGTVSYSILDENVTQIKEIKIEDLNKLGDGGNLESVKIQFGDFEWIPYDKSAVIDLTSYDGTNGFDAKFVGGTNGVISTINGGEDVNLKVTVEAKTCAEAVAHCQTYSDLLANGSTLFTLKITDIEGNVVFNQAVTG